MYDDDDESALNTPTPEQWKKLLADPVFRQMWNKNMITDRTIFVTFQKEGIHRYPDAPEGVEFLRNPHRHIFHFRVEVQVFHNDRDIEFILFKRELERLYSAETLQVDFKSCEMLAEDLIDYISKKYPGRNIKVEVSEDGENGAILRFEA